MKLDVAGTTSPFPFPKPESKPKKDQDTMRTAFQLGIMSVLVGVSFAALYGASRPVSIGEAYEPRAEGNTEEVPEGVAGDALVCDEPRLCEGPELPVAENVIIVPETIIVASRPAAKGNAR